MKYRHQQILMTILHDRTPPIQEQDINQQMEAHWDKMHEQHQQELQNQEEDSMDQKFTEDEDEDPTAYQHCDMQCKNPVATQLVRKKKQIEDQGTWKEFMPPLPDITL